MICRSITGDEETSNGCSLRAKPRCDRLGLSAKTAANLSGKEILPSAVTIRENGQIQ